MLWQIVNHPIAFKRLHGSDSSISCSFKIIARVDLIVPPQFTGVNPCKYPSPATSNVQTLINNPTIPFRLSDHRSKQPSKPTDFERGDITGSVRDESWLIGRTKRCVAPAFEELSTHVFALLVESSFFGEDRELASLAAVDEVHGVVLVHDVELQAFEIA